MARARSGAWAAAFVVLAASLIGCATPHRTKGRNALMIGEYDRAVKHLRRAQRKDPGDAEVAEMLGEARRLALRRWTQRAERAKADRDLIAEAVALQRICWIEDPKAECPMAEDMAAVAQARAKGVAAAEAALAREPRDFDAAYAALSGLGVEARLDPSVTPLWRLMQREGASFFRQRAEGASAQQEWAAARQDLKRAQVLTPEDAAVTAALDEAEAVVAHQAALAQAQAAGDVAARRDALRALAEVLARWPEHDAETLKAATERLRVAQIAGLLAEAQNTSVPAERWPALAEAVALGGDVDPAQLAAARAAAEQRCGVRAALSLTGFDATLRSEVWPETQPPCVRWVKAEEATLRLTARHLSSELAAVNPGERQKINSQYRAGMRRVPNPEREAVARRHELAVYELERAENSDSVEYSGDPEDAGDAVSGLVAGLINVAVDHSVESKLSDRVEALAEQLASMPEEIEVPDLRDYSYEAHWVRFDGLAKARLGFDGISGEHHTRVRSEGATLHGRHADDVATTPPPPPVPTRAQARAALDDAYRRDVVRWLAFVLRKAIVARACDAETPKLCAAVRSGAQSE